MAKIPNDQIRLDPNRPRRYPGNLCPVADATWGLVSHEPRDDVPVVMLAALESTGGVADVPVSYEVQICRRCGAIYWPHEPAPTPDSPGESP